MQLANSARTTLVTGINAAAGSIELSDASLFPTVTATALTGTVTSTGGNAYSLTGTGTAFLSELAVGDTITWTGIEHRKVVMVVSNTVVIIDRPASVSGVSLTKRDAYYLTIASGGGLTREYVLVLATSGATFTIARAQDGSTALAFDAGSTVEYRVTAGFITQVMAKAVQLAVANLMETHGADMVGVSASGVVTTTVRLALEELAAAIAAHLADTSAAHAASAVAFTPAAGIVATDVQAAIVELVSDISTLLGTHTGDTTAHNADAIVFAPYGSISAVEVQTAIEQLWDYVEAFSGDTDKLSDLVTTTGGVYDPVDDTQVSKAVSYYVAGGDYWSCTGSGTAFTLSAPTTAGTAGTPSYVGTGNGTMTGVSGGTSSVAETFTITCTVGGATGTFTVVGSVSGALASATVGTPYVNSKINFTLNDGAVDFIAGDVFTVTTTAANTLRKPYEYFEGMCVRFIANAANTGAPTVDVGGLGAKSVAAPHGVALEANAWVQGTVVELVYSGSSFVMTNVRDYHVLGYEEFNALVPRVTLANAATASNCVAVTFTPPTQSCTAVVSMRMVAVGTGAASVLGDKGLDPYALLDTITTVGGVAYQYMQLQSNSTGTTFPQPGFGDDYIDIRLEESFAPDYIEATATHVGEWVVEFACSGSAVTLHAWTRDHADNNDDWSFRLVGNVAYIVPYRRTGARFTPAEGVEDVLSGTAAADLTWGAPARAATRSKSGNWYDGGFE